MLQPGAVAANASRLSLKKNSTDTACIFLQGHKCAVYEHRPTQVSSTIVDQLASLTSVATMNVLHLTDVAPYGNSIAVRCSAALTPSGQSL